MDLNLLLFLKLQRMRRTALSYCVCLLNSEMAITIIVVITMIIMMNFHVAAAILKTGPSAIDLKPQHSRAVARRSAP